MRDRLPAQGMANRVKITQDNGNVIEGVFAYADGATQEGSKYNKANVLPDNVCQELGLSDPVTAEPKDAFLALAPKIGDTKTTIRTDLGDSWLLCNGEPLDSVEYPQLAAMLPTNVGETAGRLISGNSNFAYGNGYWAYIYLAQNSIVIYYTQNFNTDLGTWSSKTIASDGGATCLRFLNGRFVIGGGIGVTGEWSSGLILTATTPNGTWSRTTIGTYYPVRDIWYGGGYWFTCCGRSTWGGSSSTALLYSKNSSPTGSYTASVSGSDLTCSSMAYKDGVWLRSVYGVNNYYGIQRSTNGTSWTTVLSVSSNTACVGVDNERFFVLNNSGSSTTPNMQLATSVDGTDFVYKSISGMTTSSPAFYVDGAYVLGNAYGFSLDVSEFLPVTYNATQIDANEYNYAYGFDGNVFVCGRYGYYTDGEIVPLINMPNAYVYIKAKE